MCKTIELGEDLTSYFNIPRYTRVLFTLDMYLDFKKTLYETGDPSVIDDLDSVEYLIKHLDRRQKNIIRHTDYHGNRQRIGYLLDTSLSTVKREFRSIREVFRNLLPNFS